MKFSKFSSEKKKKQKKKKQKKNQQKKTKKKTQKQQLYIAFRNDSVPRPSLGWVFFSCDHQR